MVKHIEPAAHVALPGDLEQTRADDGPQRWRKGVLCDVGRTLNALGGDWRPDYCGRDPSRVLGAAEYALGQGLARRATGPPWRTGTLRANLNHSPQPARTARFLFLSGGKPIVERRARSTRAPQSARQ
jgi:hypothetical protein